MLFRSRAQNLYNGSTVVGCSFSFTLPVETTQRVDSANALSTFEAGAEPDADGNDS